MSARSRRTESDIASGVAREVPRACADGSAGDDERATAEFVAAKARGDQEDDGDDVSGGERPDNAGPGVGDESCEGEEGDGDGDALT